jgi:hypothetical protein
MNQIKNRIAIALALGVILAASVVAISALQNTAEAQGTQAPKRIIGSIAEASQPHDAEGHSAHEVVYYVYPREDYMYTGQVTFSTSIPVDILVYHDVTGDEDTSGLTLHNVNGRTYAVTALMKNTTAGTVEFAGAGVLAHKVLAEGEESADFNTAASIFAYARKY